LITDVTGDIFEAPVEPLVNPVNTVGVAGAGLAKMFRERFPENHREYVAACATNRLVVGRIHATAVEESSSNLRWIVNFPTKKHWKNQSQMEWVVAGLLDLRRFMRETPVKSIAVPALGAGLGGLPWPAVRAEIEKALGALDARVLMYAPKI
jgi:O-acetyl-ADP-ribose deacetylase (regulator of RNase III)